MLIEKNRKKTRRRISENAKENKEGGGKRGTRLSNNGIDWKIVYIY